MPQMPNSTYQDDPRVAALKRIGNRFIPSMPKPPDSTTFYPDRKLDHVLSSLETPTMQDVQNSGTFDVPGMEGRTAMPDLRPYRDPRVPLPPARPAGRGDINLPPGEPPFDEFPDTPVIDSISGGQEPTPSPAAAPKKSSQGIYLSRNFGAVGETPPLTSLKRIGASYTPEFASSDPSSELWQLQQAREGGIEDQIAAAQKGIGYSTSEGQRSGFEGDVTALSGVLGNLRGDMKENPVNPAGRQMSDVNDYYAKERAAILAGYKGGTSEFNPIQQASQAATAMEQAKVDSPVNTAKAAGASDEATARIQAQGQVDVAREYGKGTQQYYDYLRDQAKSGGAPIAGITAPGRYGSGSVRFAGQPNNNPLIRDLTTARMNLTAAEQGLPNTNLAVAQAAYQQARGAAFGSSRAPDHVKDAAVSILSDPELLAMDPEQALLQLENDDGTPLVLSPMEIFELKNLLYTMNGFPGANATP